MNTNEHETNGQDEPYGPRYDPRVAITVRLSQSLRDRLHREAYRYNTSLNSLAIAKLKQPLPDEAAAVFPNKKSQFCNLVVRRAQQRAKANSIDEIAILDWLG